MDEIVLHDGFVPQGCSASPQPAVSVGAGAIWLHVYDAKPVDHFLGPGPLATEVGGVDGM